MKTAKICKPDEEKCIFTEGIDYSKTGKDSIWGKGDKDMLEFLEKAEIPGKWLNLAAGDGRYNLILLEKSKAVIACDIDEGALEKLWRNTPNNLKAKLTIEVFDITKKFPLKDNSLDGIFCTGTLHLFPKQILRRIVSEIDRVLKPNGKLVIDFAADITRTSPSGKLITFGKEPLYTMESAKATLKNLFRDYEIKMQDSEVVEDYEGANPPYKLDCKFVILAASKID
jgi:SAM-dependent methyltransferase